MSGLGQGKGKGISDDRLGGNRHTNVYTRVLISCICMIFLLSSLLGEVASGRWKDGYDTTQHDTTI